jgi:hypothetical protein
MTHAEIRATYPTPGLEPTICPGELDRVLDEVDPVDGHRIHVHVCRACRATVVLDATDSRIRNDYREPARWDGMEARR